MTDTTDIEKKSLEAHVELCSERYKALERQFDTVRHDVAEIKTSIGDICNKMSILTEKRNSQLINWGIGIIVALTGLVGWLVKTYVI
jgi:ribosomal protein L29